MRVFCFIALLLSVCAGCGGSGSTSAPEQDELAAYVAEHPSPTDEELAAEKAAADAAAEE